MEYSSKIDLLQAPVRNGSKASRVANFCIIDAFGDSTESMQSLRGYPMVLLAANDEPILRKSDDP